MRILVTGATGFIGRNLIPKLTKKHKIVCFVRKSSNLDFLKSQNVEFAFGDMLDANSLSAALKKIDAVIHLATPHVQGNEKSNILGSKNMIFACKKNKVKRIIYISSMATKRKILDDYGRVKLAIEHIFENSNLDYTILRPSIIYSKNNLSLIGKSLMILPFIIPIIGSGRYKMNPVFIDDVTESIVGAVDRKKTIKKSYDVAGSENISFNEIIQICKKRFNIGKITFHIPKFLCLLIFRLLPIMSLESIKGIEEDSNADITDLRKDLNSNPISFREGVKNVSL